MSFPLRPAREPRSGKLIAIGLTFLSITVVSLLLTFVVVGVQSSVRAHVAGESNWSKAQRDASFLLIRYGQTGDTDYYRRFEAAIEIPLGARIARLELQKPDYDPAIATAGFLAGGYHPDDIPLMIRLFRCCSGFDHLRRVTDYWSRGDALVLQLQELGARLQAEMTAANPSQIRIHHLLEAIEQNNGAGHPLEAAFTSTLGETARWISKMLMAVTTIVIVLLVSLGSLLTVRTLRGIRATEAEYRTLMQNAGAGLIVVDRASGRVLEVNRLVERMIGRPAAGIVGSAFVDLFAGDDRDTGRTRVLRGADGRDVDVEVKTTPTSWRGRDARLAIVFDITERLQTERQLRIATNAIANMSEAVVITDRRFRIVSVNHAFTAITGFTAADAVGRRPDPRQLDGDGGVRVGQILRALRAGGRWHGELRAMRRSGEHYPMMLSLAGVRDGDDRIGHYIGIFTDNSAHRDYERRLRHLANHDMLTELPNRATFESKSAQAMLRAQLGGTELALLFVDLDGFKAINDTYGHGAGDRVLRTIGQRIRCSLRAGDLVGRVGGDEFNVLVDGVRSEGDVTRLARTLLQVIAEPIQYEGQAVSLSASIGISLYPRDASDFDTLVSHADMAMYEAKNRGRNNYQVFSNQVSIAVRTRLTLVNGLRQAIEHDQFQLYYQPHTDLVTGRVLGFEALLRWSHPELGWVPPAHFISIAEEMGLIDRISDWVLRTACRQGADWQARGFGDVRIAVNLSPRNFWDRDLPRRVAEIIAETGWSASLLCLEITEGTIMSREDPEELLRRLRDLGIRLAIDDFGVGYSSLGNLRRFPVDVLKIDRSFTSGIPADEDNLALVRTILALARGLGLKVIAEGIETATQRETLIAEGCLEGQGYLFGRPLPAEQIEATLAAMTSERSTGTSPTGTLSAGALSVAG
ncbi:MAG: putative bifunctional diguanylate cyclase/phosphodiesterase [Lautropia sp.]